MAVTSLYVFVSVVLLSVFVCVPTVFNCVLCYGPSCLNKDDDDYNAAHIILPICPNDLCKSSFIPRSLFSFL